MSVLIKGMEMPKHAVKNGTDDTMYRSCVIVHPDGTAELCIDLEYADMFNFEHRLKYFPLVEIPTPHERLIEAPTEISYAELYRYHPKDYVGIADYFANQIREMPTIIEREG